MSIYRGFTKTGLKARARRRRRLAVMHAVEWPTGWRVMGLGWLRARCGAQVVKFTFSDERARFCRRCGVQ